MVQDDSGTKEISVPDRAIRGLIDTYHDVVAPLLDPEQDFALVDFPDHHNVGDSAIYAGELVFLDKHMQRPAAYVCSGFSYRRNIDEFCPEGPILIHGGGNFGDVWRYHQRIRHDVLEAYPNRKVVQLAQSIHYSDPSYRDETARLIDRHSDFTLLVRDTHSLEFAQKHFDCAVHLCPDAAHNMWSLPAKPDPEHDVLSIMRIDKETIKSEITPILEGLGPIDDWPKQFWARTPIDRVVEKIINPAMPDNQALMRRRERMYRRQCWTRINRGLRLLETGKFLISDRLHVHILASLMRRPHISLDNFYGKITRYVDTWGEDGLVTRVQSEPQALRDAIARVL